MSTFLFDSKVIFKQKRYWIKYFSSHTTEELFSPEQKLGMRSAMKLLLSALPITIRPTFEIHYFARSVK